MMRIFEFVSDKHVSLSVLHDFDGFIANRLPLFKKLKWRFFATANVLVGSAQSKNRLLIPKQDRRGNLLPQFNSLLENKPYTEVGYGVSNIFKFIRVDFLHRVNYLDKGAAPFGVKLSVQFRL